MRAPVRTAIIGCGRMARGHARQILKQPEATSIVVVCEPVEVAYREMVDLFVEAGVSPPPNEPDLDRLLSRYGGNLDVALIVTPHSLHFEQATLCLEAGLDVLVEKPMVVTVEEAEVLIKTRDRTGQLLVVAFNGSLSPRIRYASALLRSGELGTIESITASVWEGWSSDKSGHWKQNASISGGGFMFDTGSHMLNTVADLAGEAFIEIAAWLENRSGPVDTVGTVMGRLAGGALVTMNACGTTMPTIGSDVRVYCSDGILRTGVWGEFLELQNAGESELQHVAVQKAVGVREGVWGRFLEVRRGELTNPTPPEVGLRLAKLWDAVKRSSRAGGAVVSV